MGGFRKTQCPRIASMHALTTKYFFRGRQHGTRIPCFPVTAASRTRIIVYIHHRHVSRQTPRTRWVEIWAFAVIARPATCTIAVVPSGIFFSRVTRRNRQSGEGARCRVEQSFAIKLRRRSLLCSGVRRFVVDTFAGKNSHLILILIIEKIGRKGSK